MDRPWVCLAGDVRLKSLEHSVVRRSLGGGRSRPVRSCASAPGGGRRKLHRVYLVTWSTGMLEMNGGW